MADTWMLMAERIGVPMTILFFFGLAVWISLRWLAKRIFEPIANSHVELVKEVKKSSETNSKTLAKVSDILDVKVRILDHLDQRTEEMFAEIKDNTRRLDQLTTGGCPIMKSSKV